jgi:hypothetical protein
MNLKDIVLNSKAAWVDFPGLSGFEIEVVNLSRKELTKLRKKCTNQKFNRKSRVMEEILDEELFVKNFANLTVKNWRGLTFEHLETLILVDTAGKDLTEEILYSKENAEVLVSSSTEFDTFINEVCFDLQRFSRKTNEDSVE